MNEETLAERLVMPDTKSPIESLSVVAVSVSSLCLGVGVDIKTTKSGTPFVAITPRCGAREVPKAIYVFSALGTQMGATRRCFSLIAEFEDREAVCIELAGLSATLTLIRDLLLCRLNPAIDSRTRARLERFCECYTPDTRANINARRESTERILGECVQHVTLLRFKNTSVVLEQVGVDYDTPTTKWRLFSTMYCEEMGIGREDAVELGSFDEVICAIMQLTGSEDEVAQPDRA